MISHLFFVDDSLIFMEADREEYLMLKKIIYKYGLVYGQLVNYEKSEMCFGKHITKEYQLNLAKILGMRVMDN